MEISIYFITSVGLVFSMYYIFLQHKAFMLQYSALMDRLFTALNDNVILNRQLTNVISDSFSEVWAKIDQIEKKK